VLLALNRPDWPLPRCLAELALLAACSEVVQKLVPGRSSEWFDLQVDLIGVALGLLLVWAWRDGYRPWLRRRQQRG
jgi:VanZ family protein